MSGKKVWCAMVLTAFIIGGNVLAGVYSGGDGTAAEPYQIAHTTDWQELMTTDADWGEHFALTAHLDLAGVTLTPVGNLATKFNGTLDGAGYTIYNAAMDMPDEDYVGLFGYTWTSAAIRNLRLENVDITGKFWVGGLVGRTNGTSLENVGVHGTVTGVANAGGIAGSITGTPNTMTRCYAAGTVTGSRYVGGLVGYIWGASLENCYTQAAVVGVVDALGGNHEDIGGLIGRTYETRGQTNTVNACYAAGPMTVAAGVPDVGGLVGHYESGMFANCFWDTQVSGQATSPVGLGKTTAQMKRRDTFTATGWDFVDVWADGQRQTYPYLRLRPAGDIDADGLVKLEDFAILAAQWLSGSPVIADYDGIEWVSISNSGFSGQMSRYETTNAQFAQYLNAALAAGEIALDGNIVNGNSGPYSGERYYQLNGPGLTGSGATDGGASRINYSGGTFTVDSGFENHPVTYVSWYGATAFANYYGWRLPTEEEWQAVAAFTDGRTYATGSSLYDSQKFLANYLSNGDNSYDPNNLPYHPWVVHGTSEVGHFGTFGYGMADMAGNVWEWTSTGYEFGSKRIFLGGSWDLTDDCCPVSVRGADFPSNVYSSYGFRVCR